VTPDHWQKWMELFHESNDPLGSPDIMDLKERSACLSVTLSCLDRKVMVDVEVGDTKELAWWHKRTRVVNIKTCDSRRAMNFFERAEWCVQDQIFASLFIMLGCSS